MKTPIALAAMTALLLPAALPAQSAADPVFTAAAMRAHVEFLADDLLKGRDTGSEGHEIAARYVASQFDGLGLKPAGDTDAKGVSWLQRITFQKTEFGKTPATLTVTGPGGAKSFTHAGDVIIGINADQPHLDVTAPLVFVGYGLENARLGLNGYAGLDVKGKIVVTLRGYPKGLPSEEGAHLSATKGKIAESHGAIGMIALNTLQSAKARPWARMVQFADEPDFTWVSPDGVPFNAAPGLRASAMLNDPAAQAVFAGAPATIAAIRKIADKAGGKPKGFALKTSVTIKADTVSQRVTSPNVVAILPGSDPKLRQEYVVLSAHLDHIGVSPAKPGDAPDKDRINNGALDNGAGIATMLEVARAMAQSPQKPRRSIIFLASTAEEKGLLGADYYARHPSVPVRQIVGNVDLDMPLLLYPFTDLIAFGADHSTLGPIVAKAVAPMGVKLSPDPMPQETIFVRSDHYMFVKQGVPAVFLATGFANGGEKAWGDFLGGAYHHPGDDMRQKIDWTAGARFAEANYRITRAMADGDIPPRWFAKDFFGDLFAPQADKAPK
ncbi:M28 family metallopeptidase [Sphingobium sp. CR2-8]|uniref:M28 family metallopeptidase n=1 Tax=Sphingobium sp. CR2-8 TaxID=1306534 RepID=UPI002DBAE46E|nr:M28 family metallopeptidase [Sphingobium sp. CR2-8]MEC3912755.1 M28 family metallopeptidase [Sphingobium sp. CR2-8]